MSPFKSLKQARWAFANKKKFAKKWAKITNFKNLPKKAKKKSRKRRR